MSEYPINPARDYELTEKPMEIEVGETPDRMPDRLNGAVKAFLTGIVGLPSDFVDRLRTGDTPQIVDLVDDALRARPGSSLPVASRPTFTAFVMTSVNEGVEEVPALVEVLVHRFEAQEDDLGTMRLRAKKLEAFMARMKQTLDARHELEYPEEALRAMFEQLIPTDPELLHAFNRHFLDAGADPGARISPVLQATLEKLLHHFKARAPRAVAASEVLRRLIGGDAANGGSTAVSRATYAKAWGEASMVYDPYEDNQSLVRAFRALRSGHTVT